MARKTLIKIFVDADVLIAAASGAHPERNKALALLADPTFEFVYSPFLKLEVLLLPRYHRRSPEVAFYEAYFDSAQCFGDLNRIFEIGQKEAFTHGIKVLDAMHIATANLARCSVLITLERSTGPMYRTRLIPVQRLL